VASGQRPWLLRVEQNEEEEGMKGGNGGATAMAIGMGTRGQPKGSLRLIAMGTASSGHPLFSCSRGHSRRHGRRCQWQLFVPKSPNICDFELSLSSNASFQPLECSPSNTQYSIFSS